MLPLDKVAEYARRAVSATRSMGVALSACTLPEVGKPSFEMDENEMELGMGIHGEPGITRGKLMSADEIADAMMGRLLADMDIEARQDVALLINGLGATPREELYIVNRRVHTWLKQQGISVYRTYVCEAATSMEMAGLSISVMKLDNELKALLDASAYSPLFSVWR
jgi:dihydroxyacetone kinase